MTSVTSLARREMALLSVTPFFDVTCECGLHRVAIAEPQICNRCGSLRLTIVRVHGRFTEPSQETYDIRA
jgi:hypothetical protein